MDANLKSMLMITLTVIIQQSLIVTAQSPVVTLNHGGQLRGFTAAFGTAKVDAFIGVRFAEPPVGNLRFKKPVEARGWSGVVDANKTGNICYQATSDGRTVGSEDCLYLNIYKPTAGNKTRAVMMFIHGGTYVSGSGNAYPGAPLAVTGDVIVITINYRLGAFGFLTDEQGNGNFGLWDQRAALQWIQGNIAAFGGDPQRVTIFGESAGAGSVSALMMSQQTDGLFARCILESGSLYQLWSWYSSKLDEQKKRNQIKLNANCSERTANIFSCFVGMTTEQAFAAVRIELSWKPTDDSDFFPDNISDEEYSPTQKYDVMAGFNGQEGLFIYTLLLSVYPDVDISKGLTREFADRWLMDMCVNYITPTSPALCQDFLKTQYLLKYSWNDRQRAIKMTYAMGEVNFNADIHRLIDKASEGNHSTYAYYFTHLLTSFLSGTPIPVWLRRSASHAEELPLVFGGPLLAIKNDSNVWLDIVASDPQGNALVNSTFTDAETDFSVTMMTLWSNFAKSGNPNQPMRLPWGVPRWPQYSKDDDVFLQLAASNTKLIRTPNKRRLVDVQKTLLSAARLQYIAENQQCTA